MIHIQSGGRKQSTLGSSKHLLIREQFGPSCTDNHHLPTVSKILNFAIQVFRMNAM